MGKTANLSLILAFKITAKSSLTES